ncbi:hypothetical protein STPH2_0618 [Streptomyces sp. KO7888]|nr:hypothetical protein [Streptomyces sp. KO7888]
MDSTKVVHTDKGALGHMLSETAGAMAADHQLTAAAYTSDGSVPAGLANCWATWPSGPL